MARRKVKEVTYYIWVEVQGSQYNPERVDETDDLDDARYLLGEYQLVYRPPNRVWVGDQEGNVINV